VSDACLNKTTNTLFYAWTADTNAADDQRSAGTVPLGAIRRHPDDTAVLAWCGQATPATCFDQRDACGRRHRLRLDSDLTIVVTDACLNKTTNTLLYTWTADQRRRRSALRRARFLWVAIRRAFRMTLPFWPWCGPAIIAACSRPT